MTELEVQMFEQITSLLAELAEARQSEREGWRYSAELECERKRLEAELAEARRERDRLREAIERAPHTLMCEALGGDDDDPCCCWKRTALEGKP